ncbi:MAG: hypothetical protein A2Z04_00870 [Chloroflexi bacterium RBG_16_57_9]|nr:MAG: hypothetical protein A2Z04_00870 [Chloroflexi bacterium RBG_16_57_9]
MRPAIACLILLVFFVPLLLPANAQADPTVTFSITSGMDDAYSFVVDTTEYLINDREEVQMGYHWGYDSMGGGQIYQHHYHPWS